MIAGKELKKRTVTCPGCGNVIEVPDNWMKYDIGCKNCGKEVPVPDREPEIVIVVEGGAVTAVATKGPGFPYRIIDLDSIKCGDSESGEDCEPEATRIDVEEYTKDIIEDARNDGREK